MVSKPQQDMPLVLNKNATMSMIFSTSAYANDHRVFFRDSHGDQTRELQNHEVDSKGARRHVHLYTSAPPDRQRALLFPRILHGFGVDDQAAAPVLSPQPTPTAACGRARLTSQVQFLAPRLKGQVIYKLESRPFR
jgi:hypothetical protein